MHTAVSCHSGPAYRTLLRVLAPRSLDGLPWRSRRAGRFQDPALSPTSQRFQLSELCARIQPEICNTAADRFGPECDPETIPFSRAIKDSLASAATENPTRRRQWCRTAVTAVLIRVRPCGGVESPLGTRQANEAGSIVFKHRGSVGVLPCSLQGLAAISGSNGPWRGQDRWRSARVLLQ
jgi:hypothetical protein